MRTNWKRSLVSCILVVSGCGAGCLLVQQTPEAQITPGSGQSGTQGPPLKLPPKLIASPVPPPEEEMRHPGDLTPRQRPTREGLLEKIRNIPGGKEMLEEARKRGARLGTGPAKTGTFLSWMNSFRVKEAEASSAFSVTLDWSNRWYSSTSSYARLYGVYLDAAAYSYARPMLYPVSSTSSFGTGLGTQVVNPFVYMKLKVDTDGWYIINLEASGSSVDLKNYQGGAYTTAASWTSDSSGSYPALLELSAGTYYLFWVTSSSLFVYEISAYSL